MGLDARVSLITLGVADLAAARGFYERLGWTAAGASGDEVAFFNLGGVGLALFPRHLLAADAGVADDGGRFSAVTLAHNVASEAAVEAAMAAAAAAGATIVKPAARTFWGGYAGYFADPDGHLWEVAHNPFFPLDEAGRIRIP